MSVTVVEEKDDRAVRVTVLVTDQILQGDPQRRRVAHQVADHAK